jgi:hypothetical protein
MHIYRRYKHTVIKLTALQTSHGAAINLLVISNEIYYLEKKLYFVSQNFLTGTASHSGTAGNNL